MHGKVTYVTLGKGKIQCMSFCRVTASYRHLDIPQYKSMECPASQKSYSLLDFTSFTSFALPF